MADNEKLLEAARMIQEHCESIKPFEPCCFAFNGVCKGVDDCVLSPDGGAPMLWSVEQEGAEQ